MKKRTTLESDLDLSDIESHPENQEFQVVSATPEEGQFLIFEV